MRKADGTRDKETLPLVSVIVPVYNVKLYLEECLDSIIAQTYKNLEILLVDDGSGDGSAEICDMYADKDFRIKVYHQENCGVVTARRSGVRQAAGRYVCFIDADDKIESGMIAFLVENIETCDLITSACFHETASGTYEIWKDALEPGIYKEERLRYLIDNMILCHNLPEVGLQPYMVLKMYRAELAKEIIEKVNVHISYSEDRDFLYQCVLKAESVRITHACFYYYRYRADSAMNKVNKNFLHDLNGLYLSLERAFANHEQKESLLRQLQNFVVMRLYSTARFMGFFPEIGMGGYVFPFSDMESGSSVILYGAGKVGRAYYWQIWRQKLIKIVLWVDKDWKKYENQSVPVHSPELIGTYEYTYLVIAVKEKELADEIRRSLIKQGVPGEKILWRVPAMI